ncbi:MAG: hypothetical protein JWP27_2377 [Flaviaesturariibacter sp.]|nr:hypothetical protein [Flaviaesturariibacter sp.]
MSKDTIEEYEQTKRKQLTRMRSITDLVMGILFCGLGVYFLTYRRFGLSFMGMEPSDRDYFLGALCLLYGLWRVYRGYKKNYFRS